MAITVRLREEKQIIPTVRGERGISFLLTLGEVVLLAAGALITPDLLIWLYSVGWNKLRWASGSWESAVTFTLTIDGNCVICLICCKL